MPSDATRPKPPAGLRRQIWTAFRTQLRPNAGTFLDRAVRTWQLGDGQGADSIDVAQWSPDLFPVVRLELDGAGGAWQNQAAQRFTMSAAITLGVPDDDQGDALDWWEAVERSFYPGDKAFYLKVLALRCVGFEVALAAVTRKIYVGGVGQVVTGRLTLHHEIPLMN